MIKRILIYILTLLFFASCSESLYDGSRIPSLNKRYLSVSSGKLTFDARPSSKKVHIESDQTDWQITIPADWIIASKYSGSSSAEIDFTAKLNNSADTSRVCVVSVNSAVSDWNRSIPIVVTQDKNVPYINLEASSLVASASKQTLFFSVDTNTEYTIDNSGSSWLHIEFFTSSEIKCSVDENNSGKERSAILTLKAKSFPSTRVSVSIRQKIANITSTKERLAFEHKGSSQTIEIDSEASWSASATSWVSATPSSGKAGKTAVTISVPNNSSVKSRSGSVYFNIAGDNNVEVPLEQEGVSLDVSSSSLTFDSFGDTQSLMVTSNESWKVTSKPDWVSINKTSGDGNETIQISVSENNTTTKKAGEIVIATIDNVASKGIQLTQKAKYIEYSDKYMEFGYASGSQATSFTTDGIWSLTKDADWFNVDKTSGSGSTTLTISVEENNTTEEREGHVMLKIAGQSYLITIHQSCKYVTLSSSAFTFSADAGSTKLSIGSNTQWAAKIIEGAEWISITPREGGNTAEVSIIVTENKTIDARRGKIEIEIPNVKNYIVDVVQNRRYIKTDMSSVDFLPTGGHISFNVITDGTYEVERIGTWFGFVKNGDVITVVAMDNNSGFERNGAIKLSLKGLDGSLTHIIPISQSTSK